MSSMMFALSLNISLIWAMEDSNLSMVIFPAPPELKLFAEKVFYEKVYDISFKVFFEKIFHIYYNHIQKNLP